MQKRSLVILFFAFAATIVAALYFARGKVTEPAGKAAPPAPTPTTAAAPKPAANTGIEPPKMSAPIAKAAAQPVVTEAKPAPGASSDGPIEPQGDVNACIAQTIKLIDAGDYLNLIKTLMPPDQLQRMANAGQSVSVEDIAAQMSSSSFTQQRMQRLRDALESVKDQTPTLNGDGTQASFDVPAGTYPLTFTKIDGYWYLK